MIEPQQIEQRSVDIVIGDGLSFFQGLDRDVALHLLESTAYKSGMVELCYAVRGHRVEPRNGQSRAGQ